MTRALPFTQMAVRRAIRSARHEGLRVVAIKADGTVLVDDGDGERPCVASPDAVTSKWQDQEA
jgi:hypothetical protein